MRLAPSRLQNLIDLQQQHEEKAPLLSKFVATVLDVVQLTSTHAQVAAVKKVISCFQDLLRHGLISPRRGTSDDANVDVTHCTANDGDDGDDENRGIAFNLFVELLFLENSVPLHRSILSCLGLLSPDWEEPVKRAFAQCLQDYGVSGPKTRRFGLAAVASSLVNLPKPGLLKGMLEAFSATITEALSHGVQSMLQEAREGGRPTPSAMEECQGAVSCLYYMLQYYPHELFIPCSRQLSVNSSDIKRSDVQESSSLAFLSAKMDDPRGADVGILIYNAALDVILDVLQTGYLSRDCSIAAGVGLCAAAQFETSHSELAIMLANSLFAASKKGLAMLSKLGLKHGTQAETRIEVAISQMRGTTLADEVGRFTEFGRLCVLRGLLTAIPRPSLNTNLLFLGKNKEYIMESVHEIQQDKLLAWTILFDGILPALCELCESSVDSHFKFHSVTALQICLQQIKASINLKITASALEELQCTAHQHGFYALPYCPITNAAVQRILQIVWNNWEDPLNQTVKQIQVVFDLLVDVQCLCLDGKVTGLSDVEEKAKGQNKEERIREFLHGILTELLSAGGHRKGRYVPLASLSSRLGALTLLNMSPNLLFESVNAMVDDDLCCSASAFLKAFFERLREDCWSSEGVMEGNIAFRRLCLPPIIAGIVSGNCRLRVNINTYALPVALQIDSDAILPMLAFALDGTVPEMEETVSWHEVEGAIGLPKHLTTNQRVALVIGLLKAARMEALMDGDLCCFSKDARQEWGFKYSINQRAFVSVKRNIFRIPLALLEIAVTHSEDSLRIDAAEALCLNPKTASMPSYLELALLRVSVPLNMRCSSTSFRMKWTSLFRKFFLRVRASIDRQLKADASRVKAQEMSAAENLPEDEFTCSMPVSVQQMQGFMEWFCHILIFSIYPSAPYERKNMAMELIAAMLESWSLTKASSYFAGIDSFLSDDATMLLLGAIVDSWDRLREGAFKILLSYPTPLPGLECTGGVEKVLQWAISLVNSPRVRESDAGALVLRLVFQKYVIQLGWTLKLHPQPVVMSSCFTNNDERGQKVGIAISKFVESLNDWLEWGIVEGEKNLLKACRHSFVHGALLSYRYAIDELDWKSDSLIAGASELRIALARLLCLLTRVTAIALWVVSADALDMPGGLQRSSKPLNLDLEHFLEDDDRMAIDDWTDIVSDQGEDEEVGFLAPSEQAIMVGCWLAMKEVSLLLGTVTRKVPLPGCDIVDMEEHGDSLSMLDLNQLELIGGHFLQVLLSMKHNGAIDKTRAGFVALCNRLLCSSDARLNKMPELWLQQLMDRTAAKCQTVDDLLRRSAGIPAAFLALFLAEPEGAPKKLLFISMRWLIDLVKSFLEGSHVNGTKMQADSLWSSNLTLDSTHGGTIKKDASASPLLLKARDEGVVPTVHAFNVMRVTFNDTNLSTDSSGFCAEGLSVAIQAFSSHHWEVRNAAILAFTALLRRMVGFLNTQTHESARRAITGFEFFHRYPLLHPFLLKELQNAASQFEDTAGCGVVMNSGSLSRTLHPSLAPVLIILSRLKPSIINSDTDDWLSPSAFMSYVSRCATQSNLKVRILASRALAPLVVADKLPHVLHELAECLLMQVNGTPWRVMEHSDELDASSLGTDFEAAQYSSRRPLSYNTVHGVLLQMHSLLTYNCVNLPSNLGLRKEVVCLLSPTMISVDKRLLFRCPMVGTAFLEVLQSLMKVEETCKSGFSPAVIRDLLVRTSAAVLDGAYDTAFNQGPWDSTKVILRVKACKLYFAETVMWWSSDAVYDERDGLEINSVPFRSGDTQQWRMNGEQFLQRLKDCLSDSMYEVRFGVLKILKGFFDLVELKYTMQDSVNFGIRRMGWAACHIQPLLIECLRDETHPRCSRYALLNYFTFSMLQKKMQRGWMDCEDIKVFGSQWSMSPGKRSSGQHGRSVGGSNASVFEMWRLFLYLYQTTKHVKTKEAAVCCLGLCIQQITQCLGKSSTLQASTCSFCLHSPGDCNLVKESVQFWLELIQKHSTASEPVMLRRATSEAILASGLLEQVERAGAHYNKCTSDGSPSYDQPRKENTQQIMVGCMGEDWVAQAVLDVWFVCIKLLEDEDMVLRERLAVAVLRVVSSISHKQLSPESVDFVPAQVERVIHLSFDFLTMHLGHSVVYLDCLANWVWRGVTDMSFMQDNSDLVRRLFDKEVDNHHEEMLLFTQLCCLHLSRILGNVIGPTESSSAWKSNGYSPANHCTLNLSGFLNHWRVKFLTQLRSFVERFLIMESRLQWQGGLTNHPDVFRALYPLLLGLLTFLGPADVTYNHMKSSEHDKMVTGMVEVMEMMKPFVDNPLIFNLLLRVLKQFEAQFNMKLGLFSLQSDQKTLLPENFDPFFLLK